jgi:hypothetical protein
MTTTVMQQSNIQEALRIFKLLSGRKWVFELKVMGSCDPLVNFTNEKIHADYIGGILNEVGEEDILSLSVNNMEFAFELDSTVSKSFESNQVSLCIAKDSYAAWFTSDVIPPELILEANSALTPMNVSKYERELIKHLRTLNYDHMADITYAIFREAREVGSRCDQSSPELTQSFIEQGKKIDKLGELIGNAHDEYRAEMNLTGGEDNASN